MERILYDNMDYVVLMSSSSCRFDMLIGCVFASTFMPDIDYPRYMSDIYHATYLGMDE